MEASVYNLSNISDELIESAANLGLRVLVAIVLYIVGKFIIGRIIKGISKIKGLEAIDLTAKNYILSFTKALLYTALIVSIVAQLGVPVTSVIALLAAAGAAIGLALQGALSNFAGGLMLLIFRPFSVGDYIISGEDKGYVKKISLIYTVLQTFDNRIISIPNGTLMNSNITNTTAEEQRRVDLSFDISASESSEKVREIMMGVVENNEYALKAPVPVVVPSEMITDGISYALRVWANTDDYWTVYEDLMESIPKALSEAGIKRPETPVRINKI